MRKFLAILFLLLPLAAWSQSTNVFTGQQTKTGDQFSDVVSAGGGGGGGWAQIGSPVSAGSANGDNISTGPKDTTGATLIVIVVGASGSQTPTDSKGNTWTRAVVSASFAGEAVSIWYCASPTTDSAQTFTINNVNSFAALAVYAFSGGAGGILDKNNSGFINPPPGTTVQPGSITPTTANQLIVTGVAFDTGTTATVDSGFGTVTKVNRVSGQHYGLGASFLVQNPAAAINPTWTTTSGDDSASIASFK